MSLKRVAPSLVSVALIVAAATADPGAVAGTKDDAAELDPVVADVVRMLGEKVEPTIIADWLESNDVWPASLSPDDLVALSRAGAPESLVRELLRHSGSATRQEPHDVVNQPPGGEAAATGGSMAVSGGVTAVYTPGGKVPVEFSVKYRREFDESPYPEPPWGLYLYLDGDLLAWHPGGTSNLFGTGQTLEFDVVLTAGKHSLRILQERHVLESKKKDRWSHEARVYPRAVELELREGAGFGVTLFVNETAPLWSKGTGPVSFALTRDDVTLSEVSGDGPDTGEWPALCEEVETGIPADKRNSRSAERALAGCVPWSTLWPATPAVPDRAVVREELAAQDYRPIPESVTTAP